MATNRIKNLRLAPIKTVLKQYMWEERRKKSASGNL
jgi:hypothetical protein